MHQCRYLLFNMQKGPLFDKDFTPVGAAVAPGPGSGSGPCTTHTLVWQPPHTSLYPQPHPQMSGPPGFHLQCARDGHVSTWKSSAGNTRGWT